MANLSGVLRSRISARRSRRLVQRLGRYPPQAGIVRSDDLCLVALLGGLICGGWSLPPPVARHDPPAFAGGIMTARTMPV